MALTKCIECGKEISDKASVCPNCGCPVSTTPFQTLSSEIDTLENTAPVTSEQVKRSDQYKSMKIIGYSVSMVRFQPIKRKRDL